MKAHIKDRNISCDVEVTTTGNKHGNHTHGGVLEAKLETGLDGWIQFYLYPQVRIKLPPNRQFVIEARGDMEMEIIYQFAQGIVKAYEKANKNDR